MELYFLIVATVLILLILFIISSSSYKYDNTKKSGTKGNKYGGVSRDEAEIKAAGQQGEQYASGLIEKILQPTDNLFQNVEMTFEGKETELDNVIVNKYGVFIVEVKNYVGKIVGEEDDFEWIKYKTKEPYNTYEKHIKNPIKQVKRQIYILSKCLKRENINVWVKGYAMLVNNNSPVENECVIEDISKLDKIIHTQDRKILSEKEIEKICNLLNIAQNCCFR